MDLHTGAFNQLYEVETANRREDLLGTAFIEAKRARKALKIKKKLLEVTKSPSPEKKNGRRRSNTLSARPLKPETPKIETAILPSKSKKTTPVLPKGRRRADSLSIAGKTPPASPKHQIEIKVRKRSKSRLERFIKPKKHKTPSPIVNEEESKKKRKRTFSLGAEKRPILSKDAREPVFLPERLKNGSLGYKEHKEHLVTENAKVLKTYYADSKTDLQILIGAALDAELPIEPRMTKYDLYLYLRLHERAPFISQEMVSSQPTERQRRLSGYSKGMAAIIDRYCRRTALSTLEFETKERKLSYLVAPRLCQYSKKHLATYLLLYLDMKNPMNEAHLIEIIHPLLPNCSRIDSEEVLFEFFTVNNLTKTKILYIILKTMESINFGRIETKPEAPSMVVYFQLREPPRHSILRES